MPCYAMYTCENRKCFPLLTQQNEAVSHDNFATKTEKKKNNKEIVSLSRSFVENLFDSVSES